MVCDSGTVEDIHCMKIFFKLVFSVFSFEEKKFRNIWFTHNNIEIFRENIPALLIIVSFSTYFTEFEKSMG